MPVLTGTVFDALGIEVVRNPLCAVALICGKPENKPHNKCFFFADCKVKYFLLASVRAPQLHILIPVGAQPAGKAALLRQDAHAIRSSGGYLLALAVSLPVADIVCQAICVGFYALFAL